MNTLTVTQRDLKIDLAELRANDMIPAVYYGYGVEEATSVSLKRQDFVKLYRELGSSTIITIETPNDGPKQVLMHDMQVDPVTHKVLHVDFLTIDMNKPVVLEVPLNFIGVAPAEKSGLGTLTKALSELEIEAPASSIPQSLDVDISVIETLEHNIYAKDVVLPAGVTLSTDANVLVVTVSEMKEEVESEGMDLGSIDATKEKVKEEPAA